MFLSQKTFGVKKLAKYALHGGKPMVAFRYTMVFGRNVILIDTH